MGSIGNNQQEEDLYRWWHHTSTLHEHNNLNVSDATERNTVPDTIREMEFQFNDNREVELGKTVQYLAEENMKLATSNRTLEKHLQCSIAMCHNKQSVIDKLTNEVELLQKKTILIEKRLTVPSDNTSVIQDNEHELNRVSDNVDRLEMLEVENEQLREQVKGIEKELKERIRTEKEMAVKFQKEQELGQVLLAEIESLKIDGNSRSEGASGSSAEYVGNEHAASREERVAAEIEKFKTELNAKREIRHRVVLAISTQVEKLRAEVDIEKERREKAERELEELKSKFEHNQYVCTSENSSVSNVKTENNKQLLKQISSLKGEIYKLESISLSKSEECEMLKAELKATEEKYTKHISALKEVVSVTKHLLAIREKQVNQLESKIEAINSLVGSQKHLLQKSDISAQKSQTFNEIETLNEDKQRLMAKYAEKSEELNISLESIRALEEKVDILERSLSKRNEDVSALQTQLSDSLDKNISLSNECAEKAEELNNALEKISVLEETVKDQKLSLVKRNDDISALQTQLSGSLDKNITLSNELSLINGLITQMLTGNTPSDIDLDKLTKLLQENHDLISDITTGEDTEKSACLPRLLLDLVCQVNNSNEDEQNEHLEDHSSKAQEQDNLKERCCSSPQEDDTNVGYAQNSTAVEIASNLPKVWKILTELLSHHTTPSTTEGIQHSDDCYRSIETPYGPKLVVSVSKTFLRLKDLILEKKALRREVYNLKQLNEHLETKLTEQEQRLSLVSTELHKTWSLVSKMRSQHQQLHHHERILRYELQQKRKLLTELKDELEYCREKWEMARQKNSESELEWQKLRREFAARKQHSSDSFNNSAESGFSDDKGDDSAEDDFIPANDLSNESVENEISQTPECVSHSSSSLVIQPACISSDSNAEVQTVTTEMLDENSLQGNMLEPVSNIRKCATSDIHEKLPVRTDSTQTVLPSDVTEEVCHLDLPLLPQPLHTVSLSTVHNESDVTGSAVQIEYPVETYCGLECSTISLIALLKQQLSYISKNIDEITSDTNSEEALQSIFFMPSIKVPEDQKPNEVLDPEQNNLFKSKRKKIKCANCSKEVVRDISDPSSSAVCPDLNCMSKEKDSIIEKTNETASETSTNFVYNDASSKSAEVGVSSKPSDRVKETREERLQRLEEQCKQLVKSVKKTSERSVNLSDRLEELHDHYGNEDISSERDRVVLVHEHVEFDKSVPVPPPMPEAIPTLRIPLTNVTELDQLTKCIGDGASVESAASFDRSNDTHEYNSFDQKTLDSQKQKCPTPSPTLMSIPQSSHSVSVAVNVSTSSSTSGKLVDRLGRTPEEVLKAREERLKRLEAQCKQLVTKVTKTSNLSVSLSNRLEELHEHYGSDEVHHHVSPDLTTQSQTSSDTTPIPVPPPFLEHLPSFRIETSDSTDNNPETNNSTCNTDNGENKDLTR